MSVDVVVGDVEDIGEGERILVQVRGREIAVFNVDGEIHAFANWCPHQNGPACEGNVTGTREASFDRETLEVETTWKRDGEILACPWHGWQFDLLTGDCLSRADAVLPKYPVRLEEGRIMVSV